eukprot:scaffold234460_cov13-Tisochrysis_lutea.AAC.2
MSVDGMLQIMDFAAAAARAARRFWKKQSQGASGRRGGDIKNAINGMGRVCMSLRGEVIPSMASMTW